MGATVLGHCGWVTRLETQVCGLQFSESQEEMLPCQVFFSFLLGLYPVSHTQCPCPRREGICPLKACFQECLPFVFRLAVVHKIFINSREVGRILAVEIGSPECSLLSSTVFSLFW